MANVIHTLTKRHLQANKGRTVITIIGIIISAAMLTAVFVSMSSLLAFFGDAQLYSDGAWHATVTEGSPELQKKIAQDDQVDKVGICALPKKEMAYQIVSEEAAYKRTADIYAGDANGIAMYVTSNYEGKLPSNENEIAIEESVLTKNHLNWKIGDTVKIPVGIRMNGKGKNAAVTYGAYTSSEYFVKKDEKSFVITAILKNNLPTSGNSIIRGMSEEEKKQSGPFMLTLKKVDYRSNDVLSQLMNANGIETGSYTLHSSYLGTKLAVSGDYKALLQMVVVLIVIIILASVCLISNTFSMSMSEKVRYLGMLASVGATKKQKRHSIYYEGFLLGIVGIPVGILCGIGGIAVTLRIIGDRIIQSGMITAGAESGLKLHTVVPWPAVLIVVVLSAITIAISLFIPAKKASAVTPIDAIRQNSEIRSKARKLRVPFYVRKIFGYEGELAYKNRKRNGRKSRVITASIAISVVLFLCVNYFCDLFVQANSSMGSQRYQILVHIGRSEKDKLYKGLKRIDGVKDFFASENNSYSYDVDTLRLFGENSDFLKPDHLTDAYKSLWESKKMRVAVYPVEDDRFQKLCKANGVEVSKYFDGKQLKGLLMNDLVREKNSSAVFNDSVTGKTIYVYDTDSDDENGKGTPFVQIGDLISYDSTFPQCDFASKGDVAVYVPDSMYEKHLISGWKAQGDSIKDRLSEESYFVGVCTDEHAKVQEDIYDFLNAEGFTDSSCIDYAELRQTNEAVVFIMQVFIYGFIVLIMLITTANIVNTIATGIHMRRKEFAMLKSVGITPKGFRKMICLESFLYGFRGLLFGLPVSILLNFAMSRTLDSEYIPFQISGGMIVIVVAAVFVIVGISMVYAVNRLRGDSIVGTLKEDISL